MNYLLDTNICIYLIKQSYSSVQQRFEQYPIEEHQFMESIERFKIYRNRIKKRSETRSAIKKLSCNGRLRNCTYGRVM